MQHFGSSARLLHTPVTPKVPFPSEISMQLIRQKQELMPDDHRPRSVSSLLKPDQAIRLCQALRLPGEASGRNLGPDHRRRCACTVDP